VNPRRLYRSSDDRTLAGVAGGLAAYLDVDPVIVRIVWFLSVFFTGTLTFWAYVVMIFVVPLEPSEWPPAAPWAPGGGPTAGPSRSRRPMLRRLAGRPPTRPPRVLAAPDRYRAWHDTAFRYRRTCPRHSAGSGAGRLVGRRLALATAPGALAESRRTMAAAGGAPRTATRTRWPGPGVWTAAHPGRRHAGPEPDSANFPLNLTWPS